MTLKEFLNLKEFCISKKKEMKSSQNETLLLLETWSTTIGMGRSSKLFTIFHLLTQYVNKSNMRKSMFLKLSPILERSKNICYKHQIRQTWKIGFDKSNSKQWMQMALIESKKSRNKFETFKSIEVMKKTRLSQIFNLLKES